MDKINDETSDKRFVFFTPIVTSKLSGRSALLEVEELG